MGKDIAHHRGLEGIHANLHAQSKTLVNNKPARTDTALLGESHEELVKIK